MKKYNRKNTRKNKKGGVGHRGTLSGRKMTLTLGTRRGRRSSKPASSLKRGFTGLVEWTPAYHSYTNKIIKSCNICFPPETVTSNDAIFQSLSNPFTQLYIYIVDNHYKGHFSFVPNKTLGDLPDYPQHNLPERLYLPSVPMNLFFNVCVDASARGEGICKRMLHDFFTRIVPQFANAIAPHFALHVLNNNMPAIKCYEKNGFKALYSNAIYTYMSTLIPQYLPLANVGPVKKIIIIAHGDMGPVYPNGLEIGGCRSINYYVQPYKILGVEEINYFKAFHICEDKLVVKESSPLAFSNMYFSINPHTDKHFMQSYIGIYICTEGGVSKILDYDYIKDHGGFFLSDLFSYIPYSIVNTGAVDLHIYACRTCDYVKQHYAGEEYYGGTPQHTKAHTNAHTKASTKKTDLFKNVSAAEMMDFLNTDQYSCPKTI